MTCKDCIHCERCTWFAEKLIRKGIFIDFSPNCEAVDKKCLHFENKTEFIRKKEE